MVLQHQFPTVNCYLNIVMGKKNSCKYISCCVILSEIAVERGMNKQSLTASVLSLRAGQFLNLYNPGKTATAHCKPEDAWESHCVAFSAPKHCDTFVTHQQDQHWFGVRCFTFTRKTRHSQKAYKNNVIVKGNFHSPDWHFIVYLQPTILYQVMLLLCMFQMEHNLNT